MSNEQAQVKENKMGVMPVTKLVFNMSLPMMVSMLVQAVNAFCYSQCHQYSGECII